MCSYAFTHSSSSTLQLESLRMKNKNKGLRANIPGVQ